jgi:uncharacterized protein with ParB-like and HNH nuclease domain
MKNKITLYTIGEILGKNFFIPSYQRGYRWTEQHIKDLLDDIDSFNPQKNQITNKDSWYCLQPLVVKKMTAEEIENEKLESFEEGWFEVVDGQQRITSIYLIIHYFNEKWIGEDKLAEPLIKYQTRFDSSTYLKNLKIDNSTNKVTVNLSNNDDIIDFFHISEAYQTIRNWVLKKGDFDKSKFQSKFIFNTQVIWYEITDTSNPIDTFIRINMGKIPLTNSELIKALFLQKRNFGNGEVADLRQIEIATEWDKIEYSLQNDDFWWFLNRDENDVSARIEFLFDIICEVAKRENTELVKIIGTDKYATFRYFNNNFLNGITFEMVKKEWDNVKDYFLAFEEWYNDTVWYHYIGFLIYSGTNIVDIYNLYKDTPKDRFTDKLKKSIKSKLENIACSKKILNKNEEIGIDEIVYKADIYLNSQKEVSENENYTYNIELQFSNKDKAKIREVLLLYNLQFIVKQYEETKKKSGGEIFVKFPFELFKLEKWDVEHIDSYTINAITDKKIQVEWIKTARTDTSDRLDGLKQDIIDFIESKNNARSFDELKSKIIELVGEKSNDEETKNSIGNLTLLSADINRSYGNSLFPTKRRIIIEKDNEGKFIPICTKNVFLKYFDRQGNSRAQWADVDIINHQNNIGEILYDFFNF